MGIRMAGEAKLQKAIDGLRSEMRSPQGQARGAMLKKAAAVDVKQNIQTFKEERDPRTGRKWLSLEDENKHYARWKRRNWPGKKMLVWTGTTMRHPATRNSDPNRIARWSGTLIQLGVTSEAGVKHQTGETYSPTKKVYLREKRPQFPRGSRRIRRKGKLTKGVRKGSNWFTLWMKRLPARPFIGKSAEQAQELRGAVASELFKAFRRRVGSKLLSLGGTAASGRLRVLR